MKDKRLQSDIGMNNEGTSQSVDVKKTIFRRYFSKITHKELIDADISETYSKNGSDLKKITNVTCAILGFLLVIYQLTVAWIGTPHSLKHRSLVAGIVLFILFLKRDISGKKGNIPKFYDIVLAFIALASCAFVFLNAEWYTTRFMLNTPLKFSEIFFGIALIIVVLEAGRRVLGFAMPFICVLALLYARFGSYFGYPFRHKGYSIKNIIDVISTSYEGIWGSPTHAATTFVFIFVIFGALAEVTGMGKFFMDFALSITGKSSGGPAKTAVVSSGLIGMIQGSSVSNVVTTGVFTIPSMMKAGFDPDYAGAVEAVASTGGQIMPPIMGASAFIMAEMVGVPYMTIAKYAIIPALLYYISVFCQIHFKSKALGLKGFHKEELPRFFRDVILKQGVYSAPIFIIIFLTLRGFSLMRAGLIATLCIMILGIIYSTDKQKTIKEYILAMSKAPENMGTVLGAVMCAGMIIAVVFISSLGLRLAGIIVKASGGVLLYALILTFIMAIILGMGMPTSGSYILLGTLLAPALIKMGLPAVQAHFFVFYYACLSSITPPVAVAAYAAAGLSGGNAAKTGYKAWRMAILAFIIPFMFVYQPNLLMINGLWKAVPVFLTAVVGCIFLATSLEGYFMTYTSKIERLIFAIGGLALVHPALNTDIIGAIAVSLGVVTQLLRLRAEKASV